MRRRFARLPVAMTVGLVLSVPATPAAGLDDVEHPAPAGFVEAQPVCDTEQPPVSSAPATTDAEGTTRIGTYNVLFASGTSNESLDARVPLIVEAIAGSGADVVGVQEDELIGSRGYTSERIARQLAETTGDAWEWCFFMANPIVPNSPDVYVGGGNPESDALMPLSNTLGEEVWRTGVGVVSRYPIVEVGAHRLPRRVAEEVEACGDDLLCRFTALVESRAALRALVDTPAGHVHVVSTHLAHGLTSFSNLTRIAQTEDLLSWIDAFSYGSAHPVVLTGDFNAGEGTPVHDLVLDAGFADTFRVSEPDTEGLTSGQSITAPSSTVRSRIDYVFAREGACATPLGTGTGIVASDMIGDSPTAIGDGFLWPSDHYGVVSELRPFPDEPETCPVTFTARYSPEVGARLYRLATNLGASSIEEIVRWGVDGFREIAEAGLAEPGAPPANDGTLLVTVTWSAQEAAAIEAAAAAWGVGAHQLHQLGGRVVAVLVYLAIVGRAPT